MSFTCNTMGEVISAVLKIDTPEAATEFYAEYVADLQQNNGRSLEAAASIARSNIGWCFGEGMSEERKKMWKKVTGAKHPVLRRSSPSLEETVAAGVALVAKMRKKTARRNRYGGE